MSSQEDISEFMKRSAYSSQLIMSALLINNDWCFAIMASNLLYERQGRRTIGEEDTTAAQVTTITIEEKFFNFGLMRKSINRQRVWPRVFVRAMLSKNQCWLTMKMRAVQWMPKTRLSRQIWNIWRKKILD